MDIYSKPPLAIYNICLITTLLLGLIVCPVCVAQASDQHPLRPPSTSSPRATLQDFIRTTDDFYIRTRNNLIEYTASGRLYPTSEEVQAQAQNFARVRAAVLLLDLSNVSPVLRDSVGIERVLQLREILDRFDFPAHSDAPDREEMARRSMKRWRLPETEIDIVLIEDGPRAGEYLVSGATVDRLPEFYGRVRHLPIKPGPALDLSEVYRALSSGGVNSLYEAYLSSPVGLSRIIPPRWILRLPAWAQVNVGGATAWQWLGLSIGLLIAVAVVIGSYYLACSMVRPGATHRRVLWHTLPVPIAILLTTEFLVPLWCKIFHIGDTTLIIITYIETAVFFLTAAWLSFIGSILVGEILATSERVERSSLDNQLVRLGTRLAGIMGAVAIFMSGADKLGFPAYSVLAGLGVGGLAVALAARDTVANFLGSMLIMFEKPFRVGDVIRVAGTEGTVEDVGFRSTRIRTPDNSLLSIPSNSVVNAVVENLSLRPMRRQRFFVQVTYDTPRDKMEQFIGGIRQVIEDHPLTNKINLQVRLNNLSESSLDILVLFHLDTADYTTELKEREAILLRIIDIAENLGVAFAFPPRTVYVETTPSTPLPVSASRVPNIPKNQ